MAGIYCVFYVLLFQASVRSFNVEERQIPVECDITGICEEAPRDQQDAVNKIIQDAPVRSFDIEGWQIPVECDITGICEEAPRDQQDAVNKIIQDLLKNNTTLQSDELVPNNSPRLNPVEDNIELCVSREKLFAPQMVRDYNRKWHRIVNTDQHKVQKFRIELCSKPNESCSNIIFFESGYSARCVQKHIMRQMQIVNDKYEVVKISLPLPSCCSCVAKVV